MQSTIKTLNDRKQLLTIDASIAGLQEPLSREEIAHLFTLADALWQYKDGGAHAILTSGLHSDGFIDTLELLTYAPVCDLFGQQIAANVRAIYDGPIDWVVGSDHAGADISQSVARVLKCRHAFTEKSIGENGEEVQLWKRHTIETTEVVLQVEELITTMTTLQRVREGIARGNPHPVTYAPIVGVVVNRSPRRAFEDATIAELVSYSFKTYQPSDCVLCKAGSEAIAKPKLNWQRLTGRAR